MTTGNSWRTLYIRQHREKGGKSSLIQHRVKKAVSLGIPLFIVAVVVIASVTGYYFVVQVPGSMPTHLTTSFPTDITTTYTDYNAAFGNSLNYSVIYIVNGASLGKEVSFNPQNPTVVIGLNNTVIWKNLDSVNQSVVATNGGFQLAQPGSEPELHLQVHDTRDFRILQSELSLGKWDNNSRFVISTENFIFLFHFLYSMDIQTLRSHQEVILRHGQLQEIS